MQCPDCGNAPANHLAEKINATFALFEKPILWPFRKIAHFCAPVTDTIAPSFFIFLKTLGLGTIVTEPDITTGGRARSVWLEAKRRSIYMWEFRLFGVSSELFVAEIPNPHKNKKTVTKIVFEGLPRPGKRLPASLAWVDDKTILKKKLAAAGIPIARGATVYTWKAAQKIFRKLKNFSDITSVIVKPSIGSRSRHTTLHIKDEVSLRSAFIKAKKLSPGVIVEEELSGMVYRGTVIGGNVIGIRRKEPPHVVGDRIHSVKELVETENQRSERQGPIYSHITIEDAENKFKLNSIPKKNEMIILSDKTSIGLGGGSTDVTDIAHPDTVDLLKKTAGVLDDPLVGADFILSDITRSWKDQPGSAGIIECNSLPFIDVHLFPLKGKPRDTAAALWDAVIAENNIV